MREETFDCAALSLKAISHPLRLKILCTLGQQSLSVKDLAETVGSSQSNVSHHLSTLRDKGMLVSTKEAKNVFYHLRDPRMLGVFELMRQMFCIDGE